MTSNEIYFRFRFFFSVLYCFFKFIILVWIEIDAFVFTSLETVTYISFKIKIYIVFLIFETFGSKCEWLLLSSIFYFWNIYNLENDKTFFWNLKSFCPIYSLEIYRRRRVAVCPGTGHRARRPGCNYGTWPWRKRSLKSSLSRAVLYIQRKGKKRRRLSTCFAVISFLSHLMCIPQWGIPCKEICLWDVGRVMRHVCNVM